MELSTIKSNNLNWGDAASDLNQNFGKINNAIEQVKNVTTRNKGYFTTSEALTEAYPNGANVGDYGYVGTSYPFNIWKWDGSNWYDTNVKGGENVNLGNFYTKSKTDSMIESVNKTVESNRNESEKKFSVLNLTTSGETSMIINLDGNAHSSTIDQIYANLKKGSPLTIGTSGLGINGIVVQYFFYKNGSSVQTQTANLGEDVNINLTSDIDSVGVYIPDGCTGNTEFYIKNTWASIDSKIGVCFWNDDKLYFNVDTVNGTISTLKDIYWGYNRGSSKDNYIPQGTTFTIKPSEYRSNIDKGGGLVKFAFDINSGVVTTLNYLDTLKSSEVIIGMASSAYGTTYSSFNWIRFNNNWKYTIDEMDADRKVADKICFFYPTDKGTVYDGVLNPNDVYTMYDGRYHEIYDNSNGIKCYMQNKYRIRLSFYDSNKTFISSTGTYDWLKEVIPPANAMYFIISVLEVDSNGESVECSLENYCLGDISVSNVRTTPFCNDNIFTYKSESVADIDTINGTITITNGFTILCGLQEYSIPEGMSMPLKQSTVDLLVDYSDRIDRLRSSQTNLVLNRLTKEIYPRCYRDTLHQHEVVLGIVRSKYADGYESGSFLNANLPFAYTVNGQPMKNLPAISEACFENNGKAYFNVDTNNGVVTILKDIYWGYNRGSSKDNYIPSGTTFTIKPSEYRSNIDKGGGLVKFVFDINTGLISTLNYLDVIRNSEVVIGMASSVYGMSYTSFNWIHFSNDWIYTIDGMDIPGSNSSQTIFSRNSNELEIMETFGASSWYEEFRYIRDEISYIPKLSFIHVSDTHASRNHFGNTYDIITNELVSFANKISTNQGDNYNRGNRVKCVLHSGDIKYSVGSDDFSYYQEAVAKSSIPFYHVLGNHDIGCEGRRKVSEAISDEQAYTQMIEPFLDVWNLKSANPELCEAHPEGKCYYFNDFENEKIRLISLYGFETRFETDPADSSLLKYRRDTESWSQGQIDWFVNSLVNLPEGWGVMIHQHYPFGTSTGESNFLSYEKCSRSGSLTIINDIVQAFMDGSHIAKQYTQEDIITPSISVDCDFSRKNAKTEFIAYLSGHTHRDCIGWIEDYPKQLQLNIGCNNTFYDEGSDVTHEMGKKGQDLFNVYCIDRNNGLVNILRVGANLSCYGQQRHMETIMYRK